ncbi:MAG: TetR/AcrR family transcriptional regulator [Rhodobacteraceae bacterium]|nr:TetR/AcrR family transcriptional regulator [Paracoccaceae bacterium]
MSSDTSNTRIRILKSVLEQLQASQEKGVRMADIAKRAGISRQALYLHFSTRAELLIETTYYVDLLKGSDKRLAASRAAETGIERLNAFIEAWGNYIPDIYHVAKALLAMGDTDDAAADAWSKRMSDMKEGCAAAINALDTDKMLSSDYAPDQATDVLWTMLSVRNWEHLTIDCGWPQEDYVQMLKTITHKVFVKIQAA